MQKKEQKQILTEIEELYNRCGSIIDAIISTCQKHQIEIETISSYIKHSKEMKELVRQEGEQLAMLEKT